MKSLRANTDDFSCWQGGHHLAPQYKKTGLFAAWANSNALATSPSNQSMPGASACDGLARAGAAQVKRTRTSSRAMFGATSLASFLAFSFENCVPLLAGLRYL